MQPSDPTLVRLAKAIRKTASIYEGSYVRENDLDMRAAGILGSYSITLTEAAEGVDAGLAVPVGCLLYGAWNDALDWADSILGIEFKSLAGTPEDGGHHARYEPADGEDDD